VLLPRAAAPGTVAGKLFEPDNAPAGPGDSRRLGSSTPDLVDAPTARRWRSALRAWSRWAIDPGGTIVQPSATTMQLGDTPLLATGVAVGRPGARLLSMLGAQVRLAEVGPILGAWTADTDTDDDGVIDVDTDGDGDVDDDDRIGAFDGVLGMWEAGINAVKFDLTGTVTTTEALLDDGTLLGFDETSVPRRRSTPRTRSVEVPAPPRATTRRSWLTRVPGGFVLLRCASPATARAGRSEVSARPAGARALVAPPAPIADRGRGGGRQPAAPRAARRRAATTVSARGGDRVALPAFGTARRRSSSRDRSSVVEREGALVTVHGLVDGAPFRVLVGGDETTADLARYVLAAPTSSAARLAHGGGSLVRHSTSPVGGAALRAGARVGRDECARKLSKSTARRG
jgi:hypothetical protein